MERRSKTDNRNFIDLTPIEGKSNFGSGKFHKKKKMCPDCKEMFFYDYAMELYCEKCRKKRELYFKRCEKLKKKQKA